MFVLFEHKFLSLRKKQPFNEAFANSPFK